MKYVLFVLFLSIALLFEITLLSLPLVLLVLILGFIKFQEEWLFLVALIAGIIIDTLSFRILGVTSLYFIALLFLIFLYKRRFEIKTVQFVFFASMISAFFYLLLLGSQNIVLQTIISGILGALGFIATKRVIFYTRVSQ